MERVLIVTNTKKSADVLVALFKARIKIECADIASSGVEARRKLIENNYTIVFINAPLPDEFGYDLASMAASETTAGVMLAVKNEHADAAHEKVENDGVMVLSKPIVQAEFYSALRIVQAASRRLMGLYKENKKLQNRLEDIKIIDRAKCVLIEFRGMSEPEAHSFIEKQAMNTGLTKRKVAQEILQNDSATPF